MTCSTCQRLTDNACEANRQPNADGSCEIYLPSVEDWQGPNGEHREPGKLPLWFRVMAVVRNQ